MIDLHTHTTASDGSVSPPDLVRLALQTGLEALAITDHDTLEGCDDAAATASELGLELIVGVELSTRFEPELADLIQPWLGGRRIPSIHLLGYFLAGDPPASFRSWILGHQESRRKRNVELVEKLRGFGFDITLAEVSKLGGKLTGRPHFAQFLLQKGYVKNRQEAFDLYLADTAQAAVEREEPGLMEAIGILRQSSALAVLAHPVRLPVGDDRDALDALLGELCKAGLGGLEVWHSEHSEAQQALYEDVARSFGLVPTGGSDFHGSHKPSIGLGTGINGNICIPKGRLDAMRAMAAQPRPTAPRPDEPRP
jgi:predicted metal-dependent phosphoesterase TrpH